MFYQASETNYSKDKIHQVKLLNILFLHFHCQNDVTYECQFCHIIATSHLIFIVNKNIGLSGLK